MGRIGCVDGCGKGCVWQALTPSIAVEFRSNYKPPMNSRAKRHHIVPQTLQRPFCNDDNKLWFSEKTADGKFIEPELRSTKGSFWMKDYYTILDGDQPSDAVETKFYKGLVDFLGHLVPELLVVLKKGHVPLMAPELQDSLRAAIQQLLKRTPDFLSVDDYDLGLKLIQSVLTEAGKGTVPEDRLTKLRGELDHPHQIKARGRDIRVRSSLQHSEKADILLKKRSFKWVVAPEKHAFVLSNLIAYRIGNGGSNGLENLNSEIWMPLAPKFAMALVNDPSNDIPQIYHDNRDHIREINEYAARQSRSIASHSRKLLYSVTGHLLR